MTERVRGTAHAVDARELAQAMNDLLKSAYGELLMIAAHKHRLGLARIAAKFAQVFAQQFARFVAQRYLAPLGTFAEDFDVRVARVQRHVGYGERTDLIGANAGVHQHSDDRLVAQAQMTQVEVATALLVAGAKQRSNLLRRKGFDDEFFCLRELDAPNR